MLCEIQKYFTATVRLMSLLCLPWRGPNVVEYNAERLRLVSTPNDLVTARTANNMPFNSEYNDRWSSGPAFRPRRTERAMSAHTIPMLYQVIGRNPVQRTTTACIASRWHGTDSWTSRADLQLVFYRAT